LYCRVDRNIILSPNDTAEPPTVTPPSGPFLVNKTWPTPSGINETEARRICQAPILQSRVFSLCHNYSMESFEFISSSCMLDLLVCNMFCLLLLDNAIQYNTTQCIITVFFHMNLDSQVVVMVCLIARLDNVIHIFTVI